MNRSTPLVSIVIPCFNAEAFLRETVDSALAQTYGPVEVIAIDDGSTDATLDILRSYGDRIRHETGPNRGGCAARNRGVESARGEMVQFLDADDLLHDDKLERQVPLLEQHPTGMISCNVRQVDIASRTERPPIVMRHTKLPWSACFDQMTSTGPLHWRRHLLAIGGFRKQLPCAQERDLHMRLAASGVTFHHVPELLMTKRLRNDSVSSHFEKVLNQHGDIVANAITMLEERHNLTDEWRRALAGLLARDARHLLRFGRNERAKAYFDQARAIHPAGGLESAYGRGTLMFRSVFGAPLTERLVTLKRGDGSFRAAPVSKRVRYEPRPSASGCSIGVDTTGKSASTG